MKQTFTLTTADRTLYNQVWALLANSGMMPNIDKTMIEVFAEKHYFKAETAEIHPDGMPKLLAEPIPMPGRYEIRMVHEGFGRDPFYGIYDTALRQWHGWTTQAVKMETLKQECERLNQLTTDH